MEQVIVGTSLNINRKVEASIVYFGKLPFFFFLRGYSCGFRIFYTTIASLKDWIFRQTIIHIFFSMINLYEELNNLRKNSKYSK